MQEIGETRAAMRERLLTKKLYDIAMEAHKDKRLDEFWIIISHREDTFLANVIREKIVVTTKKPPARMINSMCFHVVWSRGLIEPVWILPRDIPVDESILGSDGNSKLVYESVAPMGAGILA